MRIAFLNPWRNASENQAFRSLQIAAARTGHDLMACTNSDDLEQASPEFVLAVASIQPKLTRFPTYGVIHEPRDRFLGNKEYFRNLLTYDGYLTISDTLRAFLVHLMHGVGRPTPIGFYFLTSQENVADPDFLSRLERGDVRITYFGTNWDKRRARFFQLLSQRPDVEIYGPEQAWQGIRPEAYKGAPPFDGVSPQNIYRQNGVGLVLLSDKHLADDIISNRIFEITSVGAIAVCCRMPWLERYFGDSVYYFDPHCSDRALVDQLGKIVDEIKTNPTEAFSRARRAQRIFQEQFSAEKLLQSAVAYHSEVQSAPGPHYTSAGAPDPLISLVVRCGGRPLDTLRRALQSIVAQRLGRFEVILVRYKPLDLGPILSEFAASFHTLVSLDCFGGARSRTLWTGLRAATSPYFAILDDDDEILPDHFESLFGGANRVDSDRYFAYSGSIRVHINPRRFADGNAKEALERRSIESFGISECRTFFDQSQYVAPNAFVAASALLDSRLLVDPEMTTAEDSYLILALLSKTRARFTFRATAVLYESEDRSQFELDPKRADDILAYHLRLLGCYSQPPQVTDAHHVLRRLNERIVSPTIHDVEEREDVIIYHAKDSALSSMPRELLFPIPFVLDAATLTLAANSSVVDDARAAMSVTPPREPWAYAAQFGLAFAAVPNTPYLVEIDCRVTQGTVGIGVLNEKEDDFIYRLAVPAFTKSLRVHLPIEDAEAVGRFVIQSWDSGGEAHIDIAGITLLSDEKQPDSVAGRAMRRRRSKQSQKGFGGWHNSGGDWRAAVERIRRLAGWRPGPAKGR